MNFSWTLDYPVTLELSRADRHGREWFLAEIELVAHLGPGPDGWTLESWSYVGSLYDPGATRPTLKHQTFTAADTETLDMALEHRLKVHLDQRRGVIDDLWHRHIRERQAVLEHRETA